MTDISGYKVLIVEDNAVQSMTIKQLMEELGLEVVDVVDRGEKAIAQIAESALDLIIMDVFLNGDMTGIQAMQKIRETSDVPVIYISGNSDRFYVRKAKKTNFADFLHKPVKNHELRAAAAKALGSRNVEENDKKWFWPSNLFF